MTLRALVLQFSESQQQVNQHAALGVETSDSAGLNCAIQAAFFLGPNFGEEGLVLEHDIGMGVKIGTGGYGDSVSWHCLRCESVAIGSDEVTGSWLLPTPL